MDHFQEAVSEVARTTAEAQLKVIENSVAAMVRREIAAVTSGAPLPPKRGEANKKVIEASPPPQPDERLCAPIIRADALGQAGPRVLNSLAPSDTIWQAFMLAGLPIMGPLGTAALILSFFSSISMQAYVALTLGRGFAWDPKTLQGADLVEMASSPLPDHFPVPIFRPEETSLAAVAAAAGSLTAEGAGATHPGPLLISLAVLVWMLNVARDLGHTMCFISAMWSLPRHITQLTRSADMFALVSISRGRLVLAVLVASLRFGVACILLSIGSKRLANTRSLLELAITAAALGFALDVPRRAWAWGAATQRLGRGSWNWYSNF